MTTTIRRGTQLHRRARKGDTPMDTTYIVERITRLTDGSLQIAARTERQRCFGTSAAQTLWTETELRRMLAKGTFTIV